MTTRTDNTNEPLTIGQVVTLLSSEFPDVTHSSLRFLEREGFITPDRTAGGHRLFSPDQVERIRRIKIWQRDRLSLDEIQARLQMADSLPAPEQAADEALDLLVQGDREAAQSLLLRLDDAGVPLATLFDRVLRPILTKTGDQWARGEFTVGQEKEVSAFARDIIAYLESRHRSDTEDAGLSVIAACVEGEWHELGLRMITALLRCDGYTVYYLGPNVTAEFLIERIRIRKPAAVLLAAVTGDRMPDLERMTTAVGTGIKPAEVPFAILGGAGVPSGWTPSGPSHMTVIQEPSIRLTVNRIEHLLEQVADTA